MTVPQIVTILIFVTALAVAAVPVYNLILLHMISRTPKYRYEKWFYSGVLGHKEYKFRGSYASKRYAINLNKDIGVGYTKIVDTRTGETVAEFEPNPEEKARIDEVNRRIRLLMSVYESQE